MSLQLRPIKLLFALTITLSALALAACGKDDSKSSTAGKSESTEAPKSAPMASAKKMASPGETQLFWGDTHLHTNYSPDAYALLTTTADPDTSYRFAKGLPVIADLSRSRIQIGTPLDFLVVTDHAEFMGIVPELAAGNELLGKTELGRQWIKLLGENKGSEVVNNMLALSQTNPAALLPMNSVEIRKSVWETIVDTAESHNDPGKFTAFIGWEWSSMPDGRNLHRIIFTPDGKDKAMKYLPYSLLDSSKPRDLYNFLTKTAEAAQTDFVAIAHNMNLSGGSMFPAITVDNTGAIHVVWIDDNPGNWEIFYKKSANNGSTWTPIERITWNSGFSGNPSIASDSNNKIYIVWNDYTPGNWEIFFKKSN